MQSLKVKNKKRKWKINRRQPWSYHKVKTNTNYWKEKKSKITEKREEMLKLIGNKKSKKVNKNGMRFSHHAICQSSMRKLKDTRCFL